MHYFTVLQEATGNLVSHTIQNSLFFETSCEKTHILLRIVKSEALLGGLGVILGDFQSRVFKL